MTTDHPAPPPPHAAATTPSVCECMKCCEGEHPGDCKECAGWCEVGGKRCEYCHGGGICPVCKGKWNDFHWLADRLRDQIEATAALSARAEAAEALVDRLYEQLSEIVGDLADGIEWERDGVPIMRGTPDLKAFISMLHQAAADAQRQAEAAEARAAEARAAAAEAREGKLRHLLWSLYEQAEMLVPPEGVSFNLPKFNAIMDAVNLEAAPAPRGGEAMKGR